jgi:dipeptidyl aminopeptidase/acylaminoacyl peptidase
VTRQQITTIMPAEIRATEADIRGGDAHRLNAARNSQYAGTWTPNGRTIAYLDLTRATGLDIVTMGTEPQMPATPLLHSPANETGPAFSPDGRWLAFVSDGGNREEVYLVSYPLSGTATPVQVSTHGGREPVWSKRGDELFYRDGQTMCTVHVTGTDRPRVSDPVSRFSGEFDQRPASHPNYDVAADGRFLMIRGTTPPTTDTRIAVQLRWDLPWPPIQARNIPEAEDERRLSRPTSHAEERRTAPTTLAPSYAAIVVAENPADSLTASNRPRCQLWRQGCRAITWWLRSA